MSKKQRFVAAAFFLLVALAIITWYLSRTNIPVLEPAGQVGFKERQLLFIGLLLSAIVVIPVFAMAIGIAYKYRESNHKAKKYSPDWDHSRLFEGLWWGVPAAIILVLSIITWQSSHALDPYRALSSTTEPLTIQVVALDWKWLFIYPAQHIASVNLVEFPKNTPLNFLITSDTVMNSFWVPQLGGQIYAMPGMSTQLHLIADKTGSFYGSSANISGRGFASMTFTAKSVAGANFSSWVRDAGYSTAQLTMSAYKKLAAPSESNPVTYYSNAPSGLYDQLIMSYMTPASGGGSTKSAPLNQPATTRLQGMYM